MFSALPMQRISLHVLLEDAPDAALLLAESGVFDPETVAASEADLPEFPAERYREVYATARARLSKLKQVVPCPAAVPDEAKVVDLARLEATNDRLGEIWREFSALEEEARKLEDRLKSTRQLLGTLEKFAALDIDLGRLLVPRRYLALLAGTVPRGNLARLEQAAALAGHFVRPFHSTPEIDYVVVAGPAESDEDVAALLRAADFRPMKIPPEFRDHPETIRRELAEQNVQTERQAAEAVRGLEALAQKYRPDLEAACRTLTFASPYAELASKLRGRGGLAAVEGWIPRADVEQVRRRLQARLTGPHVLTTRDPRPQERARVPTLLRHPRLLEVFAALVKTYGIPRYGEFDPTILFTVTFVAMFGMMFGDVGHGAVIALGGFMARKRFPKVVPFVVAAGLSSVVFGFLYGSIFGYEELIPHLWIAPLSDPMLMLELALYWGIGFILLASLLTVYNLIREHRFEEAAFDNRGVAGIALYLAGLYAGFGYMQQGVFTAVEAILIAVPLTIILAFKWREHESPLGERILVVLIEGFESVMNYVANTLSFLRVAAFSLNHAALAVAVFTLAAMMDTTGHWITVVLGNIFITVIEGAIVTIQVLRLEYYEGFSRFFRGDGREFKPLRFQTGREI